MDRDIRKNIICKEIHSRARGIKFGVIKTLERRLNTACEDDVSKYSMLLGQILFCFANDQFELLEVHTTSSEALYEHVISFQSGHQIEKETKNEDVPEGFITCKCGSKQVDYTQQQIRSADEGATIFCSCHKCGKRWRMSA